MCRSGDPRFDGWFFVGVTSTRIYCRPSCPSRPPKAENMQFYADGRRRPDRRVPGLQALPPRCLARLARVEPPGRRRGPRHATHRRRRRRPRRRRGSRAPARLQRRATSNRLLIAEVGAGPQALARAQRAQTARVLIETTDLPFTQVAFAAGFSSIRQFNDTVRAVFAETPTSLRAPPGERPAPASPGAVALRLPRRDPFDASGTLDFLGARAIPGVEELAVGEHGACFRRSLDLPHGTGHRRARARRRHVWLPAATRRRRRPRRRGRNAAVACSTSTPTPSRSTSVLGADPALGPSRRGSDRASASRARRRRRARAPGRRRPTGHRRRGPPHVGPHRRVGRPDRRRSRRRRRPASSRRRRGGPSRTPAASRCRRRGAAPPSRWPAPSPTVDLALTRASTASGRAPRSRTSPASARGRRLRRHACPRRPRRVAAGRRGPAPGDGRPRGEVDDRRRTLATVAVLRRHAPLGNEARTDMKGSAR